MIVVALKCELVGLRLALERMISHVESGVDNLNEEQVQELGLMMQAFNAEAIKAEARIAEAAEKHLGISIAPATIEQPQTLGDFIENEATAQGVTLPSAEDLDVVAEEEKAVQATMPPPPPATQNAGETIVKGG